MKTINFEFYSTNGIVELIGIGDVHLGSANVNLTLIKGVVDYILEQPNRYCILLGDLVDNATRNSIGNVFESEMTPSSATTMICDILRPLTETDKEHPLGRIVGYCSGNHEKRSMKEIDITPATMIAVKLSLEDRYSDTSMYIFGNVPVMSRCKNRVFTIFASHGENGGGTTMGAKTNALEKMSSVVSADIYLHAHTHAPITFKQTYYQADTTHKTLSLQERLFVNINAYLNYGGYGEQKLYKPSSQAIPKIFFKTTRDCSNKMDKVYKTLWCEI